ncbi:CPBP family glutamic-type intramembrane protease [Clavibacter michiganensis]|uniref:CPBP family glutamic-type intramembrane protease n=1 Tax=Clavibacter michiganensis TaxID=28447 RepID=UPI001474D1DB|nr:CPBP family glutamic-type intramembrane protease [Clavibacter michiganensis]
MSSFRAIPEQLQQLLCVDRLQADPLPLERGWPRTAFRMSVWLLIAVLWWIEFGAGTIAAVRILIGIPYTAPTYDGSAASVQDQVLSVLHDVVFSILAGWALVTLVRLHVPGGSTVHYRHPGRWVAGALSIPFTTFAISLGFSTVGLVNTVLQLPQKGFPASTYDGAWAQWLGLADSAMAGPTEELALLGVVVVGLRRIGCPWVVVCITAVVVRLPFHMYYGVGAIGLSVWVLLLVLIYRRTGTIWGIIVAHSLWDVAAHLGPASAMLNTTVMTLAAIVISARYLPKESPPAIDQGAPKVG